LLVNIINNSIIFKNRTNILRTIVYTPGTKVMFLINAMLVIKGILNRIVGIIISVNTNGKVEAVFLTKNRIKVSASNIAIL
jgi:hypothetical protein